MMDGKSKKLRKLQDKYISLLPGKLNALNRVWLKALHEEDMQELHQLRQLAHNFAGSAGTFGFPALSVEARKLEDVLASLDVEKKLDPGIQEAIADAIQRIVSLVELGPEEINEDGYVEYDEISLHAGLEQHVYVIEDDELLAREIANQLHYFDYEVEIFSVISKAMEAIKLRIPSAMIIDVQLPEGDLAGPEFAVVFNEFSVKHVPLIFISARDDWRYWGNRLLSVVHCLPHE